VKTKAILVTFVLLLQVLLLDFLLFEKLLLNFPNEMEWDTSHWYNFAHARSHIKDSVDGSKVILTGSSVALYSALPELLFKDSNPKIHSKFYSHVALSPTDLFYYKEDIVQANPDLVVYMLNFADLQWEHVQIKNGEFEFKEQIWLDENSERFPAKTYYPFEFLRDYYSRLNKKQIFRLAAKSFLYVNRYRHFVFDPIETWFDNHMRSGRSFQRYNGSLPKEGIWSKGWTKQNATLSCTFNRKQEDSIFLLKKNTKIQVTIYPDIVSLNSKVENDQSAIEETILNFENSGWNTFPWENIPKVRDLTSAIVKLKILEGMGTAIEANLFHFGKDYPVGVRLSHYFCKEPNYINKSYSRDSYLDEKRFTEMESKSYDEDYFLRILDRAKERPELGRLNTLRDKKLEVRHLSFKPWFEFNQVLKVSNYFKDKKIPFVIVLTPENPIESISYTNDRWYKEMVSYLKSTISKNNQNLFDHTNTITQKQLFFDPHHLTYDGAEYFNPYLEKIIHSELQGANR